MDKTALTGPANRRNLATALGEVVWTGGPPPFAEAYACMRALVAAAPKPAAVGHRLFWFHGSASGSRDLPAGEHLIVGRHTAADVVLDHDPRVSLRHLLVRSDVLDDGCPIVSVVELETRQGFLVDGQRHHSIAATGTTSLEVGGYHLFLVPNDANLAPRPERPLVDTSGRHPYRNAPPTDARPRLSSLGSAFMGALPRTGASEGERYRLCLGARDLWVHVALTESDVERGVLIGRDPRCVDGGARRFLTSGISRVHLCILKSRSGVVAYDAASTQGTYRGGEAIRSAPLRDATTLILGHDQMRLQWFERPGA